MEEEPSAVSPEAEGTTTSKATEVATPLLTPEAVNKEEVRVEEPEDTAVIQRTPLTASPVISDEPAEPAELPPTVTVDNATTQENPTVVTEEVAEALETPKMSTEMEASKEAPSTDLPFAASMQENENEANTQEVLSSEVQPVPLLSTPPPELLTPSDSAEINQQEPPLALEAEEADATEEETAAKAKEEQSIPDQSVGTSQPSAESADPPTPTQSLEEVSGIVQNDDYVIISPPLYVRLLGLISTSLVSRIYNQYYLYRKLIPSVSLILCRLISQACHYHLKS